MQKYNCLKYFINIVTGCFAIAYKATGGMYVSGTRTWSDTFICYFFFQSLSTAYSWVWDVYMDWGLWRCSKPERYGLREVITYPKWYYYYAIVNDLILRLLWLFGVFLDPFEFPILVSIGWGTLMGVLELYRRWCWALLRIENE